MPHRPLLRATAHRVAIATVLAGLGAAALAASLPAPPPTPVRDVPQVLHGTTVPDPYRHLEDVKSPATQAWLKAQGEYAEQALAALPERARFTQRLAEVNRSTGDQVRQLVRLPGDRLFYLKRAAGEAQFKLVTRDGLAGAERALVDPEALSRAHGVPHAINYFTPSWDGKRLAYGVSAGGSEDASLHLMDVATGRPLCEPVPRVQQDGVSWTPDSRFVAYNQLRALPEGSPATEHYLDTTVYLLEAGAPAASARPLFGPLVNRDLKLERLDVASIQFHPDGRYMVARTTDTTVPEGKLFVARVADLAEPAVTWRAVSRFEDAITDVVLHGDTLYLRTHKQAPRGRWLALALREGGGLEKAKVVLDAPERAVLKGLLPAADGSLLAEVSEGFNTRVMRHAAPGQPGVDVAAGRPGSTFLVDDRAHALGGVWMGTSTWTEPPRIVRSAGPGRPVEDTGLLKLQVPPGTPALAVREVLVPSHDGVQVPLAIIHRADRVPGTPAPTLLVGYGAYGFSMEARFSPLSVPWLEQGGVMALVNVRGSGAFGDDWHRAGFKTTKPNTWKDGIAAARWLVAERYATPQTLGIWGTSAGGIFVGRAVTEAPDLFAAAIFDVGIMDAIRAEESANGITNIREFGTVKDPVEFRALLQMSTYHQIRDGVRYPAVMLVHGVNDPRVDVWQSAKAAARLQAASASGKPVLLRLDGQAGHGVGSTAGQQVSKMADIYAFLRAQMALPGSAGASTVPAAAR
ncbi:MAG: S9 family peptidase [Burkholderiales bacterium]|nr:S9 family peptidase [Burkholderiales bacterium]